MLHEFNTIEPSVYMPSDYVISSGKWNFLIFLKTFLGKPFDLFDQISLGGIAFGNEVNLDTYHVLHASGYLRHPCKGHEWAVCTSSSWSPKQEVTGWYHESNTALLSARPLPARALRKNREDIFEPISLEEWCFWYVILAFHGSCRKDSECN